MKISKRRSTGNTLSIPKETMGNPTEETKVSYMRQTDLFDPEQFRDAHVTVIGVGNIGSHAAHTIARLGVSKLKLYDHDTVEAHNLSSQLYGARHLGEQKVVALATQLNDANPRIEVEIIPEMFTTQPLDENTILVVAVDTMEGRKAIFQTLAGRANIGRLIIDARVGGNQLEVYTKPTIDEWGKTLTDNPADDPCGGRFIAYVSVIAGALIANQIRKFLRDLPYEENFMMHLDTLDVVKGFEWE